ncbi:MAG: endonuclease VIII [Ardenticatenaceae bacterium]|nr:endonuclease VIII [Anaerolineales bacterium]MCB8941094.1 endonuclease VIII [Ardenticatenaceae bacterium]MCB8972435.1 endonuclease VIII [Ardenticatenaceae bacterium]
MPEGPEIQLAADKVGAAIIGRPTTAVSFTFDALKKYEPILTGVVVTAVQARGKAMLTRFANGYNIYSHNQLYGIWMVRDAYDFPDTNRQLRLAIHNEQKSALLYSASDIAVLQDGELDSHPFLSKLGPDLLDELVTVPQVAGRFGSDQFRRRRLTSLLLDQGFLAGLGNYLRSEVLFVARVHPSLRPLDCTDEQIGALAEAAVSLTRQSYQTKGITNDLKLAEKLKEEGQSYRDYRFWVFDRDGRPCYNCGIAIIKDSIGGRRLYYCPNCQKKE